ncbi:hypothetical protein [Demequina sp. NBRC 110056]|uniref:hypothetical protein n=1 Tax=Demequina sp. NBRC 110056 TaxID=1570345 RepID=UPI00117DD70D|nr:hypothetical protein [Demequina sp. NBRC 110056]
MSLRTTALVAGVIGVLLLAAGLIADAQRPPRDVTPTASVDTAVVVYEPEMIAFAADNRIGFSGDGAIVGLTARPADAEAWLAEHDATYVTGVPDWETLSTDVAEPAPSPSPTVSPSASASPSEPEPSPSPSASEGESAEEAEPVDLLAEGSQDHWRQDWRGSGRLSIVASEVPAGEVLVVVSQDGTPLTSADLALTRDVQDGWITPLIWWGAFLTAVGVIALVLRFIDLRPAQAKGEKWIADRQRVGEDDEPTPGSRRARRAAGEHLPEATLEDEDSAPAPSAESSPRRAATAASAASVAAASAPSSSAPSASSVSSTEDAANTDADADDHPGPDGEEERS